MKSLGKQNVVETSFLDGRLVSQKTVRKNVYVDKNGYFFTHYISSYRSVVKTGDKYQLVIAGRTVQATRLTDLIAQLNGGNES